MIMHGASPNLEEILDTPDFLLDAPEYIRDGDDMFDDSGLFSPPGC